MKYRVKSSVHLAGRWRQPGEILKGNYEPWVHRGFLEKAGAPGTGAAPATDVAVKVNATTPPPSFTQVLEMDDDDEDLDDTEDLL